MKGAVCIVGWLAAATLSVWLARWSVTHDSELPGAPLTLPLGLILMLAWSGGAILVWRHSWSAAIIFACAAIVPLTPGRALPLGELLFAVSAALSVWAVLITVTRYLNRTAPTLVDSLSYLGSPDSADHERGVCIVCHGPSDGQLCESCRSVIGEEESVWSV